ncbi:hypothetical protein P8452_42393 [Trifolium repens]|nr:hypothetical protein P8452_21892 [Trifolium repens]WJX50802.1 hypothetical protein P8452_37055 [Trifolium repens]WJX56765.1 hypothetical protein P8452_42393 [Trifolium repens]
MDFVSIEEETVGYVIGCFYGVAQGIDFMIDEKKNLKPRYYLEIKVGNLRNELDFFLLDDVVKKAAPLTCLELEEKNGCCTIYPHELEEHFGDPILFKVRKDYDCHSCGCLSVQVLDFLIHTNLMDIYVNPNHILFADNEIEDDIVESHVFDSSLLSGAIGSDIPHLPAPSIEFPLKSNCPILDSFIGNFGIKRLNELSLLEDDSPSIVIGWYDSVFEGIDMWYPDDNYSNQPRFRLKINVRDENIQIVFALLGEQVKKLAFETYGVLTSIGESASMYPDELDVLYGDAMLLKVVKKDDEDSKIYEIVDVLTDPFILDKFFHYYMPSYGAFDCVGGKPSPLRIYDSFSSTECDNLSEDSVNFQPKMDAQRIYKFAGQFDPSTSSQRKRELESIFKSPGQIDSSVSSKCPRTI